MCLIVTASCEKDISVIKQKDRVSNKFFIFINTTLVYLKTNKLYYFNHMNISHKHKMIWFAPENTGGKITSEILKNCDFSLYNTENSELLPLNYETYSKSNVIPVEFNDYKVISNIRNPYERLFSYFLTNNLKKITLKKKLYPLFKKEFNKWLNFLLIGEKLEVKVNDFFIQKRDGDNYLEKWVFTERTPDYFIKIENLREDLNQFEFIKSFDEESLNDLITNNKFIKIRGIMFNEMYDFDVAKRVYVFYKKHFYMCGYDPFSFTTEILTDDEKISFLHDIV